MRARTLIATMFSGCLAACGGGGGDSTTPANLSSGSNSNTNSSNITLNSTETLTVEELTNVSLNVSFEYSGTQSLSVALSDISVDGVTVSSEITGNVITITLSAAELNGPATESVNLNVSLSDGTTSASRNVEITLINTSLRNAIDDFIESSENVDTATGRAELMQVATYLSDKVYLYGTMTKDEANLWKNTVEEQIDSSLAEYDMALEEATLPITTAPNALSESDFSELKSNFDNLYSGYGEFMQNVVDNFNQLGVDFTPAFAELSNHYTATSGNSFFYANSAYGNYQADGSWSFNDNYTFLTELLPNTTSTCTANEE